MSNDVPSKIHALIPILGATASIAGILTGAYGLATSDAGKKHPALIRAGIGAVILGLGFLVYKEVLRETKSQGAK